MPSHEEHCQDSLKRYGKRFDELHHWLDEPSTLLGVQHRIKRHDPIKTPRLAKELFGEFADQATLDHIRLDELKERRLKRERSKKKNQKKKGSKKRKKFHKVSMREEVTEYCGDELLEELIQKCNETRIRDSDSLHRTKRNKALIALLFLTGGRIEEVLMLKKKNFDFDNEEAKRNNAFLVKDMKLLKHYSAPGKPKHATRTFPIWNDEPLVQYLYDWLPEIENDLFDITRQRAWQIVEEVGKRLDRPLHINTSWFREQREHYLIEKKEYSPYDVQAYLKLRHPPTIFRHREDWQNLLAVTRPQKQERFYDKAPFDALRDIQGLLQKAKNEVGIVDPYVDDSVFDLYLSDVHPEVNIKLVTKNMYRKFKDVAKRFKVQKTNFEVKSAENIHDRYLIVDDRVWILGNSLNNAGVKPFYIIELVNKDRVLRWFKRLWYNAKKEF